MDLETPRTETSSTNSERETLIDKKKRTYRFFLMTIALVVVLPILFVFLYEAFSPSTDCERVAATLNKAFLSQLDFPWSGVFMHTADPLMGLTTEYNPWKVTVNKTQTVCKPSTESCACKFNDAWCPNNMARAKGSVPFSFVSRHVNRETDRPAVYNNYNWGIVFHQSGPTPFLPYCWYPGDGGTGYRSDCGCGPITSQHPDELSCNSSDIEFWTSSPTHVTHDPCFSWPYAVNFERFKRFTYGKTHDWRGWNEVMIPEWSEADLKTVPLVAFFQMRHHGRESGMNATLAATMFEATWGKAIPVVNFDPYVRTATPFTCE